MTLYYKLDIKQVINTVTDIPKSQWKKKQVLPYKLINLNKFKGSTFKDKIVIGKSLVTETKYNLIDMTELDYLKQNKVNEIKMNYDTVMNNGFTSSAGYFIDCRESDKSNWIGLKQNVDRLKPTNVNIRDKNNKILSLTLVQFNTLYLELYEYYNLKIMNKWKALDNLNKLTTISSVKSFTWVI